MQTQYDKKFAEYKAEVETSLDRDVTEHKDKEVKHEYEAEITRRIAPIKEEYKKQIATIEEKIKKVGLKDKQKKESNANLREKIAELKQQFESDKLVVIQSIELKQFYIARNNTLIEKKRKSLVITMQYELDRLKKGKKQQLEIQYKGQIIAEKNEIQEELQKKLHIDKAEKAENETVRRYQIYFRPADVTDKISEIKKDVENLSAAYLTYDNRAEKAKIERQEKALNSFLCGYVKNPYLPSYLFAPETLAQSVREVTADPEWCLESLNDRQKVAVKRALASESIFLLQGPPGTGKTQVIAELTAQLTKQGKKVLISSETHKAIDNVFERLPKTPEIRPLRLIPTIIGKKTDYSPEKLVDNFYLNICGNLQKQVKRFENFEETKATFNEEMKNLRREYDRLLRLQKENVRIESERTKISNAVNRFNEELQSLRDSLACVKEELEQYRRTIKYIESYRISKDGAKEQYIQEFAHKSEALLCGFSCFKLVPVEKIGELAKADITVIREELSYIVSDDALVELQKKQREIRAEMMVLNPNFEELKSGDENYEAFRVKQKELFAINAEIKRVQTVTEFDLSSTVISVLVPDIIKDEHLLRQLPDELMVLKIKLQSLLAEMKSSVEAGMQHHITQENEFSEKISDKQLEISKHKRRYEELSENAGIEEYSELNSALKQKITRFFRDFDIVREYDSDNLETAFDIIKDEWDKLKTEYNLSSSENRTKIPMYKEIIKYLSQDDILEEDRRTYTRVLYDSANVFGITCTSRDKFTRSQLAELGNYGIESVDIRTQGIDVVIVDEVSKSSFLDLLIPILYGKTIILVGDHRQLPPMYDLRHMKDDDFEDLDEKIITKKINDGYTELYEECFFKTLYEKVPNDFRVMLNKQYRCHSHIMEVFNHFYGGNNKGLMVGKKQQDDEKEHMLTVKINGNTIIEPRHHIYFVDCPERESSAYEGSTSKINEQEAQVAIKLLKELNKASEKLVDEHKLIFDPEKDIDERPSAGIICTYGDQAGLIKKKRGYQKFDSFSKKRDEQLIISTVDDFQGDERDIIIVSMVRNPAPGKRYDAEFIKKFERINVALSRARKLLIIVGSKQFLSEAGVIDLPDLEGRKALDKQKFHVYKEIIDTINFRGRILTAKDILGE